ncbi:MAG TPA: hypothetical protein VN814_06860 [Caulobacteraceae bacterium]|nr:hypothetical protein [Caulobacteraceae bacterium]
MDERLEGRETDKRAFEEGRTEALNFLFDAALGDVEDRRNPQGSTGN